MEGELLMSENKSWETIKTIKLIPNQKVSRVIEWIDENNKNAQYRIFIDSKKLEEHVDKKIYERKYKSGHKAKCCEIINHYNMSFEVKIQKKNINLE